MLEKLKWVFARKELEELHRWRTTNQLYRSWLAEFKDVSIVLDNLKTEAQGHESLDNSYPPGQKGPWTVESLKYVLRFKTYLNGKTPLPVSTHTES